jgi:hypothetical protein
MDDIDKQNDLKKSHNDIPQMASKIDILTDLFSPFSEKEGSKEFNNMKEDLIAYVTLQENDKNVKDNSTDEWLFKNLLYSKLEKNLIELMYIKKQDYRKERIIRTYNWYQNELKKFKDLRFINKKSYNDLDAVIDDVYFKEKLDLIKHEADHRIEDDILKEQMSHRSAIFDKSLLDEFKRNHVYNNVFYKKIHKHLEKKKLGKKKLKPELEKPDRPVGEHTIYYSFKDGIRPVSLAKVDLNDKTILAKPSGGERQRTFHTKLGEKKYEEVVIDKEIKSSFSYYRPNMDFNLLNAEKRISEQKNKYLAEKRNQEEIDKNMKDFGRMRAQYKANEEKKCELKKLVNIYTNRKKLDTKLLSKYRKNNYINNIPSPEKEEVEPNVNEHLSLNRFGSMSIKNLSAFKIIKENKSDKKYIPENVSEYNEYYYIQQQQEEEKKRKAEEKKRKEEEKEELNLKRKMQKKYTYNQVDIAKKFRRIDGDKILTNEAKNIDKQTKEILNNPSEKIPKINLCLKFKKLNATNKLIQDKLNQAIEEEKKFPNDLVYKLLVNEPTFKQELIYKKLCNFKKIPVENKKQNESFEEDESIYNNFCLSAYNVKNCKFLEKCNKKFDSDVKIMRHISSYTKFNDKKKLIDRNQNFDDYRYNYLDLRKTIGEFKKYEYEEIMNRLNKKKDIREDEKKNTGFKLRYNYSQKENNIRYMRQKVLSSALMNPNEESTFPRYFLPRTGTMLISKNEPPVAGKKKRRRR